MASTIQQELLPLLKTHFGYDSFRPNQLEVMEDVLSQKDALAIMPTGGGKSLCYQLPALAMEGTTIVISPLIALMKDQVDVLRANGITAAFYNSSLAPERKRGIYGVYHQISDKHTSRYLDEYAARFNNRHLTSNERFNQFLEGSESPLPYKKLISS